MNMDIRPFNTHQNSNLFYRYTKDVRCHLMQMNMTVPGWTLRPRADLVLTYNMFKLKNAIDLSVQNNTKVKLYKTEVRIVKQVILCPLK